MHHKRLSKNVWSEIRALSVKKYRQMYGKFLVEGLKCVEELSMSSLGLNRLIFTAKWAGHPVLNKFPAELCYEADESQLGAISSQSSPDGLIAEVNIPPDQAAVLPSKGEWIVALDQIADPGNLGTILRSAEWFGVKQVWLLPGCAERYNPKTVAASMGSLFRQASLQVNADFVLECSRQIPVYAAVLEGTDLFNTDLSAGGILLIGSESHGISETLRSDSFRGIRIPGGKHTESLNAGVAAGILMAECYRQCL